MERNHARGGYVAEALQAYGEVFDLHRLAMDRRICVEEDPVLLQKGHHLYRSNARALSNGQVGNRILLRIQDALEAIMGIEDCYEVQACEEKI